MKNSYILALGSNTDSYQNIELALEKLRLLFGTIKQSRFIETAPVDINNDSMFLNGLVLLHSELQQEKLKSILKNIEEELGRSSSNTLSGIIPIDIDIIKVNDQIVHEDIKRDYIRQLILEL